MNIDLVADFTLIWDTLWAAQDAGLLDDVCTAMAHLHEATGITQEETER